MRQVNSHRKGESSGGIIFTILLVLGVLYFIGNKDKPGGGNPLNLAKPSLPVVVTYRESLVGEGIVAIFSNQTSNRLTITVEFESRSGTERKRGTIDLDPNGKSEIGWMEGWKFESGESIALAHPNYSPRTVTIP